MNPIENFQEISLDEEIIEIPLLAEPPSANTDPKGQLKSRSNTSTIRTLAHRTHKENRKSKHLLPL